MLQTCVSLWHENFGKGVFERNFLLGFIFLSLCLFISAASDHYLIGNNITVAVLGIVIPIGEYSCCLRFLFAGFSLLASPSLLVAQVLHVVQMCSFMCLAVCVRTCMCEWLGVFVSPPDWLKLVYFRFNNNYLCLFLNAIPVSASAVMLEHKIIV